MSILILQKNQLFSILLGIFKLCDDDFRAIVEPEGDDTVTNAPAHDHLRAALGKQTGIVLREQTLIGCKQTACEGQTELAAVGVSAENKIDVLSGIHIKKLRTVR